MHNGQGQRGQGTRNHVEKGVGILEKEDGKGRKWYLSNIVMQKHWGKLHVTVNCI